MMKVMAAAAVSMLLAAPLAPAKAQSQTGDYPNHAVRLIVPFGPGGTTDTVSRLLAQMAGERLGKPMVIENRAGATGTMGADAAARSAPDGYTLVVGSVETYGMTDADRKRLPYDPLKDFEPVVKFAAAPNVIVVNPEVPVKTIKELGEYAKAHPGQVNYASPGIGSNPHIIGAFLANRLGADMVHVPYQAAASALSDVVSGRIQVMVTGVATANSWIKSGKLRPLAMTGARRSMVIPDVPTMAEAGLDDFVLGGVFAVFAPAGTPAPVAGKIEKAVKDAMQTPAFKTRLVELGAEEVEPQTGAALGNGLNTEAQHWRQLSKVAGL